MCDNNIQICLCIIVINYPCHCLILLNFVLSGVITYVLLSGQLPFNGGDDDVDKIGNIMDGDYNFDRDQWRTVSLNAKDFIRNLLQSDQDKRLNADQALNHRWITKKDTEFEYSSLKDSLSTNNLEKEGIDPLLTSAAQEVFPIGTNFAQESQISALTVSDNADDDYHDSVSGSDIISSPLDSPQNKKKLVDVLLRLPEKIRNQVADTASSLELTAEKAQELADQLLLMSPEALNAALAQMDDANEKSDDTDSHIDTEIRQDATITLSSDGNSFKQDEVAINNNEQQNRIYVAKSPENIDDLITKTENTAFNNGMVTENNNKDTLLDVNDNKQDAIGKGELFIGEPAKINMEKTRSKSDHDNNSSIQKTMTTYDTIDFDVVKEDPDRIVSTVALPDTPLGNGAALERMVNIGHLNYVSLGSLNVKKHHRMPSANSDISRGHIEAPDVAPALFGFFLEDREEIREYYMILENLTRQILSRGVSLIITIQNALF